MMRLILVVFVAVTVLVAQEPPADLCGRYVNEDGFRMLTLWGTPEQRGFAHGWLLADVIVRNLDADMQKILRGRIEQYEGRLAKMVVPRFAFTDAEEAELAGLMKGIEARLPDPRQRTLSFLGRPIKLVDLKAATTCGDWMALGCSTFAIDGSRTPDGRPGVARNFDFPGYRMVLDDQHVVVHAPRGDTRGWVGVSYPGCIGTTTAMNAEGLFISIHDVPVFPTPITAVRRNVPRLCALRRVMEEVGATGAIDEVHQRLRGWPTLYGNNFMVVTPAAKDGAPFASVFEYDNRRNRENGVQRRDVDHAGAERALQVLCTNHHRVRRPRRKDPAALCSRYNELHEAVRARASGTAISVEQMFETLSVAAFPKGEAPQRSYRHGTTHQVVGFTGARELHVKLGRVGRNIRQIPSRRVKVSDVLATARAKDRKPAPEKASSGGR